MDPKELAAALRLRLRLDPPIKRGVPKLLFNQFIKRTAGWLANGSPLHELPLFSLDALRNAIAVFQRKGRMPTNRRSATDPARRAAQISETVTSALTGLTTRLRDHHFARKGESGDDAVLLSFEISLGQEVFAAEITGLLPKNRDGLGFPEDERVGLLGRLTKRDTSQNSTASPSEGERAADKPTLQSITQEPRPEGGAARTPFGEHSQLFSAVLDLSSKLSEQVSEAQPPRSPRELPQPPRDFAGRDEELREILGAIRTLRFTIVGLQGPGGIGKTALALALAAKLSTDYESSIFVDLKGNTTRPLTPSEVMRHVLLAHYPTRTLPDSPEDLSGLYHSLLHEKPALLLLDNARDAMQLQPLIPPTTSFLLITSIPRFTVPGMHREQIDPLESEAARAMLVAIAPRCAAEAETIAALCSRFPLALRAAGHALAETPSISPAAYAARLQETRKRLELVDPTTERSVEAVLDLSYALLTPVLQERFDSLAVFPATFDSVAAGAIWRLRAEAALDTLAMLVKFSLVEYDPADDRYHLHELLRLFANSHLKPSVRDQLDRRFARRIRTVLLTQPWIPDAEATSYDARHRLALEWPSIRHVYRWALAKPEGDAYAARFLATFQWSRALLTPMDRTGMLQWIMSGTRLSNSRLQNRIAAMNIVRKAVFHALAQEFLPAVHELGRLSAYIQTFSEVPFIHQLLLQTLQTIALGDSVARDIILAFLLPFARSQTSSLDQAQLLTTVGAIYGDMGNHADAVVYFDRAMTMIQGIDPQSQLAISLPAHACTEAIANNDVDLAAAHVDALLKVANADNRRLTTILLGRLAPVLAVKGDIARSERLHDLYTARSRDVTFLPEGSRTLTNTAKIWYSLAFLEIGPRSKAKQYENRAIELLVDAMRVARERDDSEAEEYARVPLGLLYAARKSFARAKALLPATQYREITRDGGTGLRDSLIEVFSNLQP